MKLPPQFEDAAADAHPAAAANSGWELRADSEVRLDGAILGRLRAGIVLGLRACRDVSLRDLVARRLLLRLGTRL